MIIGDKDIMFTLLMLICFHILGMFIATIIYAVINNIKTADDFFKSHKVFDNGWCSYKVFDYIDAIAIAMLWEVYLIVLIIKAILYIFVKCSVFFANLIRRI